MQTKEEILNYISNKLENAEKWVFISNEVAEDKVQTCMLSPNKEQALICIMHLLRQEPSMWYALKNTMDK